MRSRNLLLTVLGSLLFMANTLPSAAATNYTISVTVTGLTGTLVMEDSKNDLTLTPPLLHYTSELASDNLHHPDLHHQRYPDFCQDLRQRRDVYRPRQDSAFRTNLHAQQQCDRHDHFQHHRHGYLQSATNYTISVAVTGLTREPWSCKTARPTC